MIPKIWRWAEEIKTYDYKIKHRSGSRMRHVDALSRHTVLSIEVDDITARIVKLQEEDDELNLIKRTILDNNDGEYSLRGGVLYKFVDGVDLLMVPASMEDDVIKNAHEKGHSSVKKTQDIIEQEYYIPQLKTKVEKYISNCVRCIIANRKEGKQEGFLQPLQKPDIPLHTLIIYWL